MSLKFQTIFRVLGNAFLTLAAMPDEVSSTRVEMSAKDYINTLDNPAAGIGTAAEVFAPAPANEVAAAVFAPSAPAPAPAPTAAPAVAPQPIYTMTAKAEGFTREDHHEQGWADEDLVNDGYMTVTFAAPAAKVPPQPNPGQQAAMQAVVDGAAATQATINQSVMKDNAGLPWDSRIHSGARTQTAAGAWTKRKGVSPAEVARVTSELLNAAPAAAAFTPLNAVAAAPAPAPAAQQAPTPAAAPAPAPAATATAAPTDFASLCRWITANGFTMPQAGEIAKNYGINAMGFLAQPDNAAIIPLVYADLLASRA